MGGSEEDMSQAEHEREIRSMQRRAEFLRAENKILEETAQQTKLWHAIAYEQSQAMAYMARSAEIGLQLERLGRPVGPAGPANAANTANAANPVDRTSESESVVPAQPDEQASTDDDECGEADAGPVDATPVDATPVVQASRESSSIDGETIEHSSFIRLLLSAR